VYRYILDIDGNPLHEPDLMLWATWMEFADRRVAFDNLAEGVDVSTVFLGLDHNWGHHDLPILFETMVFGGEMDGECERYSVRQEALDGHAVIVQLARAMIGVRTA